MLNTDEVILSLFVNRQKPQFILLPSETVSRPDSTDACCEQNDEEFATKRPVLLGEGPQPHTNPPTILPPAVG